MSSALADRPGAKFADPDTTATGERRAVVAPTGLATLWFNTGTLCNITCRNCYIESSPRNDSLAYLRRAEVRAFLAEAAADYPELEEIGFTGGEPFMNPDIAGILEDSLLAGWRVLVLTNAMRPLQRPRVQRALLELQRRFPGRMTLRVSLDHYTRDGHESLRGGGSWAPTLAGLRWLAENGFDLAVAGRTIWGETDPDLRAGYAALFVRERLPIDAVDPRRLVLFPEMDPERDVPEITERCWGILGKHPDQAMCASSRMVIRRRGAARPAVVACTLLPYDSGFELGATLAEAARPVKLNHRYCAQFCVLGGASCSPHG
ncbi:MAG: radical SAM protein [Alphaproteobacteria bacterium]|nr:radical SAM protein [Alphaproteobacteria bacterium]